MRIVMSTPAFILTLFFALLAWDYLTSEKVTQISNTVYSDKCSDLQQNTRKFDVGRTEVLQIGPKAFSRVRNFEISVAIINEGRSNISICIQTPLRRLKRFKHKLPCGGDASLTLSSYAYWAPLVEDDSLSKRDRAALGLSRRELLAALGTSDERDISIIYFKVSASNELVNYINTTHNFTLYIENHNTYQGDYADLNYDINILKFGLNPRLVWHFITIIYHGIVYRYVILYFLSRISHLNAIFEWISFEFKDKCPSLMTLYSLKVSWLDGLCNDVLMDLKGAPWVVNNLIAKYCSVIESVHWPLGVLIGLYTVLFLVVALSSTWSTNNNAIGRFLQSWIVRSLADVDFDSNRNWISSFISYMFNISFLTQIGPCLLTSLGCAHIYFLIVYFISAYCGSIISRYAKKINFSPSSVLISLLGCLTGLTLTQAVSMASQGRASSWFKGGWNITICMLPPGAICIPWRISNIFTVILLYLIRKFALAKFLSSLNGQSNMKSKLKTGSHHEILIDLIILMIGIWFGIIYHIKR